MMSLSHHTRDPRMSDVSRVKQRVWEHVEIKGFQSLYDVSLDLGMFTVIVGPSSSGKSAFIRAIKGVTSNIRGTGVVSHSRPGLSISVRTPEATVTLEKGIGANGYRVTPRAGGDERVWSKLGGSVPDAVSMVLTTDPVKPGSTWFAGQFDGPYLVGDPGSQIAGVLGNLSGVGIIRDAAREGSRRFLESSSAARAAAVTVEQITARIPSYADLPERIAKTQDAQHVVDEIDRVYQRAAALATVVAKVRQASERVQEAPAEVPTEVTQGLAQARARWKRLAAVRDVVAKVRNGQAAADVQRQAAEMTDQSIVELRQQYAQMLSDAGVCPTCGASTHREGENHG